MTISFTLEELAKLLGIPSNQNNTLFHGISIDTRTLTPKNLFVAVKGEQFDGHDFIAQAEKNGAVAAIVNRSLKTTLPQLIVPDTLLALGKITQHWRNRFQLPLIGVTGSCGKTTLKNMIASILRAACHNDVNHVLATEGNLNNNIGVPLMLAKLNPQHRYGVIEMGMNSFGEIEYLTQLVKPDVAVLNNAAPAHLQGVGSIEGVARAKGEIFSGLSSRGVAILNRDDDFYEYWHSLVKNKKSISFGLKNSADVSAELFAEDGRFLLKTPKGDIEVQLAIPGKHNIMNGLAACAAALALDFDLKTIKMGLEQTHAAPGRMRQHRLENNILIIDDTYNANPGSTLAAINTLKNFSNTKILVLGDMRELGPDGSTLHFSIGEKARDAGIDYLFTFGELTAETAKAFGKNAHHFTDKDQLIAELKPLVKSNMSILVKGSRSMKMEKVLAALVPEAAHEVGH